MVILLRFSFRSDFSSSAVYLSSLCEGQVSHGPLLLFSEGPPIAQEYFPPGETATLIESSIVLQSRSGVDISLW